MNFKKEFRNFAVKHHGVNNLYFDNIVSKVTPVGMTPYIMEERQLNVTQIDVFSRLMMDRIIFLGTGIDDQVANIVQAQFLFLESLDSSKDIQIYINSPGGGVYAGLGIYDTMQFIKPDVQTYGIGMAMSMGSILLAAGAKGKRHALPNLKVMMHQPSAGTQGKVSDMEISLQESLELKERLAEILSSHTGKTVKQIHKDWDRDNFLTAEEAKKYGIVDQIVSNRS